MRSSSVELTIIELLEGEERHLTAKEILQKIRPRLPAVNPSTVYRALERLAASGAISVSHIGSGAAVFEKIAADAHHHVVCKHCGQITTLDSKSVTRFFAEISAHSEYSIITNHLVLFGICAGCRFSED